MIMKRLLSLTVAGLLVVGMTGLAMAGIPSEVLSTASSASGCIQIVPDGSGPTLGSQGLTVTVTVVDGGGAAIAGYPFQDVWLGDDVGGAAIALCNGAATANANTNAAGVTQITGSIAGGGSNQAGSQVYLAGVPLNNGGNLSIDMVSPDMNGDRAVTLIDLSDPVAGFAVLFNTIPVDFESDYDCNNLENLLDVVAFANANGSVCP